MPVPLERRDRTPVQPHLSSLFDENLTTCAVRPRPLIFKSFFSLGQSQPGRCTRTYR